MILRDAAAHSRSGLTLLEVLVALTIFLLSLGAITQLVTFASQRAIDARHSDDAARMARSKLAEVIAGAVALQSQGETPFDEDPDYLWSISASSGSLTGLWVVTVTVKHKTDRGPGFVLNQFVLDPTLRGSTQDTVTISGTQSTSSGSGSGSSSSAGSSASGTSSSGKSNSGSTGSGSKTSSSPKGK